MTVVAMIMTEKIGKYSEVQIHFSDIILDSIAFIIKVRYIIQGKSLKW